MIAVAGDIAGDGAGDEATAMLLAAIRPTVVLTTGDNAYPDGTRGRLAGNGDAFGVLKVTLHATSFDWKFVPEAGKTYSDSGSAICH